MLTTDDTQFPLVTIKMGNTFTDEDIEALVAFVDRVGRRSLAERRPFVLAASSSVMLRAEHRRLFSERYNLLPEEVRNAGLQSFAYLETPLVRGALRALQWSVPGLLSETVLTKSHEESVRLATELLARQKYAPAQRAVLSASMGSTAPSASDQVTALAPVERQSLANPW